MPTRGRARAGLPLEKHGPPHQDASGYGRELLHRDGLETASTNRFEESSGSFPDGNISGFTYFFDSYQKEVFMCWVWLFLAISLEVAATVFMKLSDGFSKTVPTVTMALLYAVSFLPLAIALKRMDVAIAYAVWSAVGTAMVTIVGIFLFKESVSALKVVSIALIIIGVVSLNLSTRETAKPSSETTASVEAEPEPLVKGATFQ